MDAITASIGKFAREIANLGESTVWGMIARGELETINIGKRRLVVVESYRKRIDELKAKPPQDARRNSAVPSLGTRRRSSPVTLPISSHLPEGRHKKARGRPRKNQPANTPDTSAE
jgi:hypothetical protein